VPPDPGDALPNEQGWGIAGGLRYLEIMRGAANAQQQLPLLVVIHGMGDQPSRAWLNAIDVDVPARMILPQAPNAYGSGFSWFEYRLVERDETTLASGIALAAKKLSHMLEVLQTQRSASGRAVVTGFSQGGMLSFALALRHPEQIAYAVPISGYLPEPLWPASKPSASWFPGIQALHGTADPLVSYDADARGVTQLRKLGYAVELASFENVQHTISPAMSSVVRRALIQALKQSN
jgi:phospholipase/carboxylesterase